MLFAAACALTLEAISINLTGSNASRNRQHFLCKPCVRSRDIPGRCEYAVAAQEPNMVIIGTPDRMVVQATSRGIGQKTGPPSKVAHHVCRTLTNQHSIDKDITSRPGARQRKHVDTLDSHVALTFSSLSSSGMGPFVLTKMPP